MNMHTSIAATDRTLLPRGLIGRRPETSSYRFELGARVEWYGNKWLVLERQRTAMGREIYRLFRPGDERPERHVDGKFLNPAA